MAVNIDGLDIRTRRYLGMVENNVSSVRDRIETYQGRKIPSDIAAELMRDIRCLKSSLEYNAHRMLEISRNSGNEGLLERVKSQLTQWQGMIEDDSLEAAFAVCRVDSDDEEPQAKRKK